MFSFRSYTTRGINAHLATFPHSTIQNHSPRFHMTFSYENKYAEVFVWYFYNQQIVIFEKDEKKVQNNDSDDGGWRKLPGSDMSGRSP